MYRIEKVLNNNSILASKDNQEVIFLGKGIGFGKKINDIYIPGDGVKKYKMETQEQEKRLPHEIIRNVDPVFIEIASDIIRFAQEQFDHVDTKILLPLADHIDFAIKRNYAGVVTIDGNNKDGINKVIDFIEKLKEGYDYIQGSRFIKGGTERNTPPIRLFAIKCIHAPIISFICKKKYTDTTNLFRGYSMKYLKDNRVQPFRKIFKSYELSTYLSTNLELKHVKYQSIGNIPILKSILQKLEK